MRLIIIMLITFFGSFTLGYILTPENKRNNIVSNHSDKSKERLVIVEDETNECQIPRFILNNIQKAGINVNKLDENSWNKFIYKTKQEGIKDIEAEFEGNTLHFLTQTKNKQAIEKYLNLNFSEVDAINKDGLTALAIAMKNHDLDIVEMLLNHGANLYNTITINGVEKDMLDMIMQTRIVLDPKKLKQLKDIGMDFSDGEKYLLTGRARGSVLEFLLPNTNVNARSKTENHIFAEILTKKQTYGKYTINYFLDNGVEFHNIPSKLPPLNAAVQNRSISPDHIERMINAGANINFASTDMKETPLMLAVKNERLDLAEVLLANGAKVFSENNLGKNAFKYLNPEDNEMKELLESYSD